MGVVYLSLVTRVLTQHSQNVSEEEVILRFEMVWLPCC